MYRDQSALDSIKRAQGAFSFPEVASLNFKAFIGWVTRRYLRRKVRGNSMYPTLLPEQEVLVAPIGKAEISNIMPGEILLIQHPLNSSLQVLKRCSHWEGTKVCVLGDNPDESTDSRHFGNVASTFILGKVICTFP